MLIDAGRKVFESDVARIRLRGRGNLSEAFLRSVNPVATIVSPSLEPAPEAMGMIGKAGRFSHSPILGDQSGDNKEVLKPRMQRVLELRRAFNSASEESTQLKSDLDEATLWLEQDIASYAVTMLRTDGVRIVLAQRSRNPHMKRMWRIYVLIPNEKGKLEPLSKRKR